MVASIEDAAIAPNGSVWAATRKGIVTSADGGVTFAAVPGSPAAQHVAFDTLGRVYVVDWQNTGLWRFDGTTWTNLRKDPFLNDVAIDPTNPKRIVAVANDYPYHDEADATGVWVSTDDGVSWSRADEGLAMTRVATVAFDANVPGRVLIGTYGNGFWERNLNTAPAVKPIPSTATTVPAPPAPAPPPS